jgi:hypothetical protein
LNIRRGRLTAVMTLVVSLLGLAAAFAGCFVFSATNKNLTIPQQQSDTTQRDFSMVQSNEIVRIRMKADMQILPALLAFIYG